MLSNEYETHKVGNKSLNGAWFMCPVTESIQGAFYSNCE